MYSSFNQVIKTVYFGSRTKKGCSEVAMRAAAIWLLAPTAQCFAPAATAGDPAVATRVKRVAGCHQLSRDPTNFRGLVLGCIEAKFCK